MISLKWTPESTRPNNDHSLEEREADGYLFFAHPDGTFDVWARNQHIPIQKED
jgi:hypothetical protein